MLFKITVLAVFYMFHGIGGMPLNQTHPCFEDSLCEGQLVGKPNSRDLFVYQPDDRYYYTCVRDTNDTATLNKGCIKCPFSFSFSRKCDQCLTTADARADNCFVDKNFNTNITTPPCDTSGLCKDRENGNYAYPENERLFFTCREGNASLCQSCPTSLVYNEECDQCQFPGTEVSCLKTTSKPNNMSKENEKESINCDNELCQSKADGSYELRPSSSDYYQCANEICFKSKCFGDLVFSKACGGCSVEYVGEGMNCTETPMVTPNAVTDEAPVDDTRCDDQLCKDKENGGYEIEENSGDYIQCSNGFCYKAKCVASLVFSQKCGGCDREYIGEGMNCTETTTEAPSSVVTDEAPVDDTRCDDQLCKDKENGGYEIEENSGNYIQCSNGFCYKGKCVASLVFSQKCGGCDREYIGAGMNCTTETSATSATAAPNLVTDEAPVDDTRCDDQLCKDKENGGYETEQNSENYIQCSNGFCYKAKCVASLVFSQKCGGCDREYIGEDMSCEETTTTTTAATNVITDDTPVDDTRCDDQLCKDKENGGYETEPNSENYIQCSNGFCYKAKCVASLVFSQKCGGCDREYIGEDMSCEETTTTTAATSVITDDTPVDDTRCDEQLCKDKENGGYETEPNSENYIQCSNGFCYKARCVASLVFSQKCGGCDREYIGEDMSCEEATTTTTTTATTNVISDNAPVDDTRCDDQLCKDKENGGYEIEANSGNYIQCSNGFCYKAKCVANLVFSQKCGGCDRRYIGSDMNCTETTLPPTIEPDNVQVDDTRCDDNLCKDKENGGYEIEPDLSNYYQCSNGFCYKSKCVANLVYSQNCGGCDRTYFATKNQCPGFQENTDQGWENEKEGEDNETEREENETEENETETNESSETEEPQAQCPKDFCKGRTPNKYYINDQNKQERFFCVIVTADNYVCVGPETCPSTLVYKRLNPDVQDDDTMSCDFP